MHASIIGDSDHPVYPYTSSTMAIQAILIDLDNTLFHWTPCDREALRAVHDQLRQRVNVTFDRFVELNWLVRGELKVELANQGASHNRVIFFKKIVESLLGKSDVELVLNLYETYWATFLQIAQPQPDAHAVLEWLSQRWPVAMISNHTTEVQLRKVAKLEFDRFFTTIVTSEETGVEKPDPRIYQTALARLGSQPADTVMIGDHPKGDIQGAKDVGLTTIQTIEFAEKVDTPAADHVIANLGELPALLERLV